MLVAYTYTRGCTRMVVDVHLHAWMYTHGSGCTLSAAICSYIALGFNLIESINKAKSFIEKSLEKSYKIGSGPGPLGHYQ